MTHSSGVCGSASTRCALPLMTRSNAMLSSSAWANCSAAAGGCTSGRLGEERGRRPSDGEAPARFAIIWRISSPGVAKCAGNRHRRILTHGSDRAFGRRKTALLAPRSCTDITEVQNPAAAQKGITSAGVRRTLLIGLCLFGAMPALARGQQPGAPRLTELTLEQLGDIEVVSGSKRPEEVWRTPLAIHVITREDIRRSGATSIPEVLRLAPGVEVARIDSDHWSVGVRGFGDQFSKSVVVLIDGRSVYTPLFAGVYWPAHDVLLEDVDRIEVIRGPGGTIWGSNAVNGVINIITTPAAQTHGTMVSAGGGNIDRSDAALRYGGGNGSTFDYRLYGKGINRGAERHSDGIPFDEWWTGQVGFRTEWTPATGDTLTLQGDLSKGQHGQRASVASFSPPSQVPLEGDLDASGANVRFRWERESTTGRGFRLQTYYDRTSWLAPHFGERRNTFDADFVHHVTLARRHTVTAGVGARISPARFIQTIPTLDFSPRRETSNVYTGFEVEPSIRALWTPRPGQSAWAAVTRAVRTPSRIEDAIVSTTFASNVAAAVPVFLRISGNPDFEAE